MKNKALILPFLLILLPLIDSLFIPQTFGIQWHSPKLMYQIGVALMIVKLTMVAIGLWLLLKAKRLYMEASKSTRIVKFSVFLLGGLQVVIMTAICFWYLVAGTQAKYFMLQDNIAVFTADYGVFAPVHHEFSFICFDANGFYHMQPIAQLPWLGTFTFTSQDSRLIIQHKNQSGANTQEISLKGFGCLQ